MTPIPPRPDLPPPGSSWPGGLALAVVLSVPLWLALWGLWRLWT